MKKLLLVSSFILLGLLSCTHDRDDNLKNVCNVANPTEDLPWLKDKIQELEQSSLYASGEIYISQTTYNGDNIFIIGNCCATCNTIVPIYNCEGDVLGSIGDGTFDTNLLETDVIIWKPENFVCN